MNHAPQYIETMRKLAPLIRDVPKFCVWQFDMLCDWFAFYWNRGTLSFYLDTEGANQGVCAIKLFSRLEQFLEPFIHEPGGRFAMIELMSARSSEAMGFIYDELVKRWGRREVMIWDRGERTEGGAPRMYRWDSFEKLARRITNGQWRGR